jgi:hypothetical protein
MRLASRQFNGGATVLAFILAMITAMAIRRHVYVLAFAAAATSLMFVLLIPPEPSQLVRRRIVPACLYLALAAIVGQMIIWRIST